MAGKNDHLFWKTQPVPDFNENVIHEGPIDDSFFVKETPYRLPDEFSWTEDIDNDELYNFLSENYVEDNDNMFRCIYSVDFLTWLNPIKLGVRTKRKLVGFISSVPIKIRINQTFLFSSEINFLCVHKKLRSKRLAPVLIRELGRISANKKIFQHLYTGGNLLPCPISKTNYYHRPLNIKPLWNTGFLAKRPGRSIEILEKLYRLDGINNLRQMCQNDVHECYLLLSQFLQQFALTRLFTEEEFKHYFLPRPNVIYTYVIETNKKITDFVSFYSIPSLSLQTGVMIKTAYLFYYANTVTKLQDLIQQTLLLARAEGFDVFNCLNIMHNEKFLKELNFFEGDGTLYYYLYNWRCQSMETNQLAVIIP